MLGSLLFLLHCGQQSERKPSLEELKVAAEQGDAIAQFTVGGKYELGRGVPEDDAEAVKWYRLAGEQGPPCQHD